MDSQQHGEQLKRGLKNRHIQLIALGGAIGTGLFSEAPPLFSRRGQNYLGYAVAGFIAFLIMRQLGRWWLKNRSPALLATSPINTGAALPDSLPAGTTGCCTY